MSRTPNYIPLPPPPSWSDIAAGIDSAASPAPSFYTPPTSPTPSPNIFYTPPTSPFHDLVSPSALVPPPDIHIPTPAPEDHFPVSPDVAIDLVLDDDGLSALEKIYLYSRSSVAFHRIFIAHRLPEYLLHVTPQEAVEYVLPLLSGLAMDDEDSVKEALAAELIPVVWWFFTQCQIIPDDLSNEEKYASSSTTVTISVQAFTPILGTLLLSETERIGSVSRQAIVKFLTRMRKMDERESGSARPRQHHPQANYIPPPWEVDDDDDEELPASAGLFGSQERALFTQEILQQIVVGMGRLDVDVGPVEEMRQEPPPPQQESPRGTEGGWGNINPYFPPLSHNSSLVADTRPRSDSPFSDSPSSTRRSPSFNFSPLTELPPADISSPSSSTQGEPPSVSNAPSSPMNVGSDWDEYELDQGTSGRVACMSLVAAVTAGGPLDDDTLESFLNEVERVVHDSSYRVRKAASFALGALAKVVPDKLVVGLLPLFDSLRWDAYWDVRHSALFALPAILGRLSPAQRRTIALETVVALSADQHPTVRCGVLESLGEVVHSFIGDAGGPPEELVHLFLGRKEDRRVRDGQQFLTLQQPVPTQTPLEAFFTHPKRPLICAFNFPAVSLTLGERRWGELRKTYLELAENPDPDVLRTLGASMGELAKIIGPENARRDLVAVWRRFVQSDKQVRPKAVDALEDFIKAIGIEVGKTLIEGLLTAWNEDVFKGWRERESIQKKQVSWLTLLGLGSFSLFRELLVKGLEDGAATVREAAISAIPEMWTLCSSKEALDDLSARIRQLAKSSISRRRMTFIACQQTLVLSRDKDGRTLIPLDDSLHAVADLANDDVEGVRIGVARFAALTYRNMLRHSRFIPTILLELVHRLTQDPSHEVQSYIADVSITDSANRSDTPPPESKRARAQLVQAALFSRPPFPRPSTDYYDDPAQNTEPSITQTFSGEGTESFDSTAYYSASRPKPSTNTSEQPSSAPNTVVANGVYASASYASSSEPFITSEFQNTAGGGAAGQVKVPG